MCSIEEEQVYESPESTSDDETSNGEFCDPSSVHTSTSSNYISLLAPVRVSDEKELYEVFV